MNILDNELVRKYFAGCDHASDSFNSGCLCRLNYAAKILRAMQQPIREGDRMLRVASTGFVDDQTAGGLIDDPLHFEYLRLPDRFQKAECQICNGEYILFSRVGAIWNVCGKHLRPNCNPPKPDDAVEKKECICDNWQTKCPSCGGWRVKPFIACSRGNS